MNIKTIVIEGKREDIKITRTETGATVSVERFSRSEGKHDSVLAEFRRDAQLLVVSHQKRTMEAADCLLGVTMQPGGSSKVIVEHAGNAAS